MREGVLIVSFGTSVVPAMKQEILPTHRALKDAAGDRPVYFAYTSPTIRRIWAERGQALQSPAEALEAMAREGIECVYIQPTHVIFGYEYDKLKASAAPFGRRFRQVLVGQPLLQTSEDLLSVAHILANRFPSQPDQVQVLLGHGTAHAADMLYAALQTAFCTLGRNDLLLGTIEGWPTFEELLSQIKSRGCSEITLAPFLLVAGEHARWDMGGSNPTSWASRFQAEGFRVNCVYTGLGQYEEIRSLYVSHLKVLLGEA